MLKISKLIIIWLSISASIILYNLFVPNYMSLHEISSAIYFMGMYGFVIILWSKIFN